MNRPSAGTTPPSSVALNGAEVMLEPLARAVCEAYFERYTGEFDRYGEVAGEWCLHDNQWILYWAATDAIGATDLIAQVRWLAGVLASREFPLDRLAGNLLLAAVVAEGAFGQSGPAIADRLRAAAELVDKLR